MPLPTESTPRERLARILVLVKRSRRYVRGALLVAFLGIAAALALALSTKPIYRSETTVRFRDAVRAAREGEGSGARAAKLGPKLKEIVLARPRLSSVIEENGLYSELAERSMMLAVDELQKNISFRVRSEGTFVISFLDPDPAVAQRITARLAEAMIEDYSKESLDTASLTHDFLEGEAEEAAQKVEAQSRALAVFLAKHPQFTWGINDSPYAAGPDPRGSIRPAPARPRAPQGPPPDPEITTLNQRLAQIDTELSGAPPTASLPAPASAADASKQKDAAAAALAAAEADLAAKLQKVTPLHPDAVAAKSKVNSARAALAAAEGNLRLLRTGASSPRPHEPAGSAIDPARREALLRDRQDVMGKLAARRSAIAQSAKDKRRAVPSTPPASEEPETTDVVELETEWHKLRLDLERARDHLRKVQDKERVAALTVAGAAREIQGELVVVEPAYLPVRPDKGRGRVFFAGVVVALFFALGYATSRVLLNDTLFDEGDVAAAAGPEHLVTMPRLPNPALPSPSAPSSVTDLSVESHWFVEDDIGLSRPSDADVKPGAEAEAEAEAEAGAEAEAEAEAGAEAEAEADAGADADADAEAGAGAHKKAALSRMRRTSDTLAVRAEPEGLVVELPLYPASEEALAELRATPPPALGALRVLRHRLELRRQGGPLVVSVVSPGDGEGKTVLAARLAMTLAEADRARVILVEGNLGRPRLASLLGVKMPNEVGLSAQVRRHMEGRWGPWRVLCVSPSVYLLGEGSAEASFPGALHSKWFLAAIHALRESYDYVLIDGCPVLGSGDANVLEDVSDVVLLVARSGVTKATGLVRAARQLGERHVLGVVLNDVVEKQGRFRKKGAS